MSLNQATEPTGTVQVGEVINTEYISRFLETTAIDPMIGEQIAKRTVLDPTEVNSYDYKIVTRNEFTGAAVVAENDAAPEESFAPTGATISGARRGLRSFVLDATKAAVLSASNETIRGLAHGVRDLIHQSIMATFTSIAASDGDNATNNTLANWDTQTAAFRAALHDPGELWAAMNPDATRDLRSDLIANAAALFSSSWGDRAATALQNKTPGMGRPWDGYTVYESHNTPAGDTTGWTNAMGVKGQDSGTGLELIVWDGLAFELQRDAGRYGTWIVAGTIVGLGIRNQKNVRAFITRT